MMIEPFHRASQYLSTVAISFLDRKEDDSHTNLGWRDGILYTHPLSDQHCALALDYRSFSLSLINNEGYNEQISLHGKTHFQIITWIRGTALQAKLNKVYEYKLHFDLPYEKITSDYVFKKPSEIVTTKLIQKRNVAQKALEKVLEGCNTSIRIWPHHFDTGAFFNVNDQIGIGLGMAVPDAMIDDFYFYVSGYRGHDIIDPSTTEIKKGAYYQEGWKGFALPVSEISIEEAIAFFQEAIQLYKAK